MRKIIIIKFAITPEMFELPKICQTIAFSFIRLENKIH